VRARFLHFTFDGELRELSRDGVRRDLTPKALELLEELLASAPAPVSKEALYQRIWPDVVVEPGNLHNLIAEIRNALGDEEHDVVRTIHRFGYAIGVPVEVDAPPGVYLLIGTRQLPLRAGENVIGREAVGTPDVSRRHARIVIDGQTALIEDLGSKNGTFVDGNRLADAVRVSGDTELILGRTRALLRFASSGGSTITV
jgi:DNA-binding winged helix-turn-helix (wHTH) protein